MPHIIFFLFVQAVFHSVCPPYTYSVPFSCYRFTHFFMSLPFNVSYYARDSISVVHYVIGGSNALTSPSFSS